jgi:hypothetical protein
LHPFLSKFVDNWPVKDYLKRHFSNQRNYRARIQREAGNDKGKAKADGTDRSWMDDMFDFGSDAADGEGGEEGGPEI